MRSVSVGLAALLVLVTSVLALEPVPRPRLEGVEEAVAEAIRAQEASLDGLLARDDVSGDVPSDALAVEFAALGMLYHAYGLGEPAKVAYRNALELRPEASRLVYFLALLEQSSGRYEAAARAFGRYLEAVPMDPPALLRRADALLELGRLEEARRLYETVFGLGEEAAEHRAAAWRGLGRTALAADDPAAAIEPLEAALAAQPAANRLHYFLAQAHRKLGDREAAAAHAARYGSTEVIFPEPLITELRARATGVTFHVTAGDRALAAGRFELAEKLHARALELDPESVEAHRGRATALEELGRLEAAAGQYEAALRGAPENAQLHFYLGRVRADLGEADAAVAALEEALRLDPRLDAAALRLAELRLAAGDAAAALARAGKLLEHDPQNVDALLLRARAEKALGRTDEAQLGLERLVELDPENVAARMSLGVLLTELGRTDAAAAVLRAALARAEVAGDAGVLALGHYNLGVLERDRGRLGAARLSFRAAVEADPELWEARFQLANLLAHGGDYTAALEHFAAVVAAQPRHVGARLGEATAYLLAGRPALARDRLAAGVEALPEELVLKHTLARLLATSAEPSVRDGETALALALDVFTARRTLEHGETVAMAYAAAGDFAEAARWQERLLQEITDPEWRRRLEENLERYRAGRGVGEPR